MKNIRYLMYGVIQNKNQQRRKQILYDCQKNIFLESAGSVSNSYKEVAIFLPILLAPILGSLFYDIPMHIHWYWEVTVALITVGIFAADIVIVNHQNVGVSHRVISKCVVSTWNRRVLTVALILFLISLVGIYMYITSYTLGMCVFNYCIEFFDIYIGMTIITMFYVQVIRMGKRLRNIND